MTNGGYFTPEFRSWTKDAHQAVRGKCPALEYTSAENYAAYIGSSETF